MGRRYYEMNGIHNKERSERRAQRLKIVLKKVETVNHIRTKLQGGE